MNHTEKARNLEVEWSERGRWILPWIRPTLIAAAIVTIALAIIVAASKSAWMLLGAGRGFIPEGYYHLWGFMLLFGTVFGQAVGWAGGSAVAVYAMTLVGFPANWTTARLAMSIVYLGLAGLPLSAYHILYGGWLLNMPRVGLKEWLAANYPGAYWLLIPAHPIIDLSLIPLGIGVLLILWKYDKRLLQERNLQTLFFLLILGTSLAVALSLAIHSTLVHIRIGV